MAQLLFVASASLFVLMGLVHGAFTLRDLGRPRSFTPTEEAVREAMVRARLQFAPRVSIWRAWLGFNLTHSLGLLVFGLLLAGAAIRDFAFVSTRPELQAFAVVVAVLYAAVAARFFFWAPASGASVGALGFLASALLS